MLVLPPFARLPTPAVPTHPLQPSRVVCHDVTTPITHCNSIQLKHNTNPFSQHIHTKPGSDYSNMTPLTTPSPPASTRVSVDGN
jgi:hypothetical protein